MEPGGRGVGGGRGDQHGGLVAGKLTGQVIGMAIKVHKTVGPGLFESFMRIASRLNSRMPACDFERQVVLPWHI